MTPGYCGFGWTGCLGALDFAGGTVIHITSGWAGLSYCSYAWTQAGLWKGSDGASQYLSRSSRGSSTVGRMVRL